MTAPANAQTTGQSSDPRFFSQTGYRIDNDSFWSLDYVAGMMQWNLNFQLVVPQSNEEWGFGVIRSDWSGRPAYSALLEMSKP